MEDGEDAFDETYKHDLQSAASLCINYIDELDLNSLVDELCEVIPVYASKVAEFVGNYIISILFIPQLTH